MKILILLSGTVGRAPGRPQEKPTRFETPGDPFTGVGDMRGSYGFGRRAHRPDPTRGYCFDNDANYWVHHSVR
jgi:hypothetical protein